MLFGRKTHYTGSGENPESCSEAFYTAAPSLPGPVDEPSGVCLVVFWAGFLGFLVFCSITIILHNINFCIIYKTKRFVLYP